MRKEKGFTLIELLVVIAIIGILASMALVALSGTRAKARDATRKSDLRSIKSALEVYYSDQKPNVYMALAAPATATAANTGLTTDYIKTFPTDPVGTDTYLYCATTTDYAIFATLENKNDGDKKTGNPAACNMPAASNYWVQND